MTIENKSKDKVITFIPLQIYRKIQLGLTDGLQLNLGVAFHIVMCGSAVWFLRLSRGIGSCVLLLDDLYTHDTVALTLIVFILQIN